MHTLPWSSSHMLTLAGLISSQDRTLWLLACAGVSWTQVEQQVDLSSQLGHLLPKDDPLSTKADKCVAVLKLFLAVRLNQTLSVHTLSIVC